ncbi:MULTISPECIES: hypothetical protein [unclassified Duganella]|uniref:hypothetical protein n=1 Tax=unclassified Duganella TaxID=2636909 RepID=UPI000882A417|nr:MULTISPECIES: hypothetical protein [unclassified Duganella]SDG56248.1 hypothetical protein SAMN05216320_105221 [Duganella sp. OV458]SDJ79100.1 hypothetical protein SAMN05428973_106222 [Duganella sp. OV510]
MKSAISPAVPVDASLVGIKGRILLILNEDEKAEVAANCDHLGRRRKRAIGSVSPDK